MPVKLITAILIAILPACASFTLAPETGIRDTLPLAHPSGPSRRIVQRINAQWQDRGENFLCVLELDRHHLAVAGLSLEGVGLFNLSYDGDNITMTKSPLLPDNLPPDAVVKDLQLVYWPLSELQKTLPKPWRIVALKNRRLLYNRNNIDSDVDYVQPDPVWAKAAVLTNHRFRYRLEINTVSYEVLPE